MLEIATVCADLEGLRHWVNQQHGIPATDAGNFWLPIVWTARGPLYAEVIAQAKDGRYNQPFPIDDRTKQPLFYLAYSLLSWLKADPSVYLMQVELKDAGSASAKIEIFFDRLIPFPSEPAIASIGVQEPNLFTCHWLCLTNQPILDLIIKS